ncbi:hypothetical protein LCGC14_1671940 [marine sediment metagenome]|uniref:Uncharacterized protein n=1 Tax=marine sediment metagenome TaxID=412755 RepID=A0A0F9IDH7_9ZZZZ
MGLEQYFQRTNEERRDRRARTDKLSAAREGVVKALELAIEEHPSCIHPACPIKEVGAWCCFVGVARAALKEYEEANKCQI